MSLRFLVAIGFAASFFWCAAALAQPSMPDDDASPAPEPAPAADKSTAAADVEASDASDIIAADRKAKARERFRRGVTLFEQEAWTAALSEFLESRNLYPSRSATKNAAVCFRRLERFDESLDMFETLLREFPDLPEDDKQLAQREIPILRSLVGTIEVEDAEPGASIIVDGRTRADFPLVVPLRVPAGSHSVRVFKEGFEPYETRVDVAGGQRVSVAAPLQALTQSGRLRVVERSGKKLEVVIDGAAMGKTPWEGLLSVGEHGVVLRGEGNVGSAPASANVRSQKVTALTLIAEPLESSVLIRATPVGANVTIDSVSVGRGVWDGLLKTGPHWIEVSDEGFLPQRQQVDLARGEKKIIDVVLERDQDAARWQLPSRVIVGVDGGLAIVPTFAGDVAGNCEGDCSQSVGLGARVMARVAYRWGSGLGLGLSAGYLGVGQSVQQRTVSIRPQGLGEVSGVASDDLSLRAFLVGLTGSFEVGSQFPALFRMGAGAVLGSVRDIRNARFSSSFDAPEQGDDPSAVFVYVDPEVRIGWEVLPRLQLSVGASAMVLIAVDRANWGETEELPVVLPNEGYATYAQDELTGPVMLAIVPGLGASYSF